MPNKMPPAEILILKIKVRVIPYEMESGEESIGANRFRDIVIY